MKGLGSSTEAFGYVFDAIRAAGYEPGKDVKLALDVAAACYNVETKTYQFQGKAISSQEMVDYLVGLVDQYEGCMLSIEDGLDENDWEYWPVLTEALTKRDVVTIGDDLFVTQLPRLEKGIATKAATAILVKVNQNGSMSGTFDVMKRARSAGMKCVISHRSVKHSTQYCRYRLRHRSHGTQDWGPTPRLTFQIRAHGYVVQSIFAWWSWNEKRQ